MTDVLDEAVGTDDVEELEDEETVAEPEPETEFEVVAAQTDIDIEKAFEKIARENDRHTKRIAEIMGPDFESVFPCDACAGFAAGFVLEEPQKPATYQPAKFTETCPECTGMGDVATGAKVRNLLIQCERCGGRGYIDLRPAGSPVAIAPISAAITTPGATDETPRVRSETDDPWGRPAGHVHWGLPPSSIGS